MLKMAPDIANNLDALNVIAAQLVETFEISVGQARSFVSTSKGGPVPAYMADFWAAFEENGGDQEAVFSALGETPKPANNKPESLNPF